MNYDASQYLICQEGVMYSEDKIEEFMINSIYFNSARH